MRRRIFPIKRERIYSYGYAVGRTEKGGVAAMPSLDLQTLFAISLLIELILALMTLLYWQTQQIYQGFAAWTGAFLLKAL